MEKIIAIAFILSVTYFGAKVFLFPFSAIQNSHIEANVPPESDFKTFMERDLLAFSKTRISSSVTSVDIKFLRDGPTQSGTSLPKYYVWLQVFQSNELLKQGAIRMAAINRKRFEVTDFITAEQIKETPDKVEDVFPKLLVANILSLAGVK